MEALRASSFSLFQFTTIPARLPRPRFEKPMLNFPINHRPNSYISSTSHHKEPESRLFTAASPAVSTVIHDSQQGEKFDWYAQWYPIMPVCDLDKRVPHAKRVMGLDVVVWWDRNESAWKVLDDRCPHRLAPLSEGRIDQWGRLQCVYHGWCFNGSGDCKFIPQAPPEGPPVHTFKNARVAVYPSTVQNDIVWFWPNSDPQHKDILEKQKPPYMPELDDPSYTKSMGNREIPYGYEVLIENLMDPAHVPYAHYGMMQVPSPKDSVKADREGGRPLEISIKKSDLNGFIARQEAADTRFIAPCVFSAFTSLGADQSKGSASPAETKEVNQEPSSPVSQRRLVFNFICVPVSPGNSRLIWASARNFGVWIDRIVPRWMFHLGQNLLLDSDLYLLHLEERKIMDTGPSNWQKACFVPTKSDAQVVGFRRWLIKHAGGQVDWGAKFSGTLPPSPPGEQLLDRYWSHVTNCSSCRVAYKGLNTLEIALQVIAFASGGIVAAVKQEMLSSAAQNTLVAIAVLCFVGSRWLSHFVYKNFHYHDCNHAVR
ncbi:protochlorophyllide-dependent translocon component 52, chloroplastic-like isoform X1 [Rhododendron vialii]|uniref:protochlorophyllide-dependent translocon component 52, chloroplastic-like isoform X1 n=1 Tax=Rhododendron vialii TaxID=182163 RepID=UPI00265F3071|nr:protochlorophyllide-dependent translocon component 52, chloroplastic-like isoform X1 [Rhododendron vialii]